jgi:hypothetical protein
MLVISSPAAVNEYTDCAKGERAANRAAERMTERALMGFTTQSETENGIVYCRETVGMFWLESRGGYIASLQNWSRIGGFQWDVPSLSHFMHSIHFGKSSFPYQVLEIRPIQGCAGLHNIRQVVSNQLR